MGNIAYTHIVSYRFSNIIQYTLSSVFFSLFQSHWPACAYCCLNLLFLVTCWARITLYF